MTKVFVAVDLIQRWQDAANRQDVRLLLELSDSNIAIVGSRGISSGHQILSDWVQRAGVRFATLCTFARDDRVVVDQHGEWRSLETGVVTGEADVAASFYIHQGARRTSSALRFARASTARCAAYYG